MDIESQRLKGRDGVLSSLDVAIEAINLAKEVSSITPAKAVFGSVSALLTMMRDSMVNKLDYIELGLACADVCHALDRGVSGRRLDELSPSVCEAIEQLKETAIGIQRRIVKKRGRGLLSRVAHARNDKENIATWKLDLNRILHVFNTELAINTHIIVSDVHHGVVNTHAMVSDLHRIALKGQEESDDNHWLTQTSIPGVSPPPPPRIFYGRDELVEKIVGLAEDLVPIALIGAGGIGKTSTALTVLHNNRVKQRFGDDRRFIRCDQFPASLAHSLDRISKITGAGIENPEDLAPLRPFLSSREILIILDNAECILDPRGTNAREIYGVVEELSQFSNICLCITSRITTVPPACETLNILTLSMGAARDTFYRIYNHGERSDLVDDIIEQLDFHPLSITLLATVAHHSKWDIGRLNREWGRERTDMLHTQHDMSLAATIKLSLTSPMFQELGPDAQDLLGVIAFFPQGVDEKNLDWLFPTISNGTIIFDKFCILSLTYRSNGFITMLAPLRDHFYPKDPKSSPLLHVTKECYFSRLLVRLDPDEPYFGEAQWITSEDTNVEHLLEVFTTIDANSNDVWDVCDCFMEHLCWHKPRVVILGPKIEGLPDDHPSKPQCLLQFSRLSGSVGNYAEYKRLLTCALKLWRTRGDVDEVALALMFLGEANRLLNFHEEGIEQMKEALEIYERLDNTEGQVQSLQLLAWLLYGDKQLDAAEEAASRTIDLLPDKGEEYLICKFHHVLGNIYDSKGEMEKAIYHFEKALEIASGFCWYGQQFCIHSSLAELFCGRGRFDDAQVHIERAKLHTTNDKYLLGHAMKLQADLWYLQDKFEEAKSEALRAADIYERVGAAINLENCRELLGRIEAGMNSRVASDKSDPNAQGAE